MDLSTHTWSNRYITGSIGWDVGTVSEPLKEYIDNMAQTPCHILVPGGGNGHEAEYLYHLGFKDTFLLDWAQEPLDNFQKRVPDFPSSNLLNADFFKHSGQYDLILEQTFFCAIDPKLRPDYAQHMYSLLKPGGHLVGLLFDNVPHQEGPPFGGSREEYLSYFEPLFRIHKMDRCLNSIKPRAGRELFIDLEKLS